MNELTILKAEEKTFELSLRGSGIDHLQFMQILEKSWSDKLKDCDKKSIVDCCIAVADTGLQPNPHFKHYYFIPFNDTKANKKICTFMPGYLGLMDIGYRGGQEVVKVGCVREGDTFEEPRVYGELPVHIKSKGKRGAVELAFCVTRNIATGTLQHTVLVWSEIEKRRAKSKTWQYAKDDKEREKTFWGQWEDEMCLKTVLRYHFGRVQLNPKGMQALATVDKLEYEEARDVTQYSEQYKTIEMALQNVMNDDEEFRKDTLDFIAKEIQEAKLSEVETALLTEKLANARGGVSS
jgi:phage RecT family recombinase